MVGPQVLRDWTHSLTTPMIAGSPEADRGWTICARLQLSTAAECFTSFFCSCRSLRVFRTRSFAHVLRSMQPFDFLIHDIHGNVPGRFFSRDQLIYFLDLSDSTWSKRVRERGWPWLRWAWTAPKHWTCFGRFGGTQPLDLRCDEQWRSKGEKTHFNHLVWP